VYPVAFAAGDILHLLLLIGARKVEPGAVRSGVDFGLAEHNGLMAFEGDSKVVWFEGNYSEYDADRKKRLGKAADQPHRIRYRKLTR